MLRARTPPRNRREARHGWNSTAPAGCVERPRAARLTARRVPASLLAFQAVTRPVRYTPHAARTLAAPGTHTADIPGPPPQEPP
jgi:hypothetical protein